MPAAGVQTVARAKYVRDVALRLLSIGISAIKVRKLVHVLTIILIAGSLLDQIEAVPLRSLRLNLHFQEIIIKGYLLCLLTVILLKSIAKCL